MPIDCGRCSCGCAVLDASDPSRCVVCGGGVTPVVDPHNAGLALRLVAVLCDLQRARGAAGADATAHRLALHRERRALCDALGLSPDTGA